MTLLTELPISELSKRMEKTLPFLMEQVRVPGLSLALIRDARIEWFSAFGVRRAGTGDQITSETIFQAASLSKPLFAFAVLHLVEQGIIGLDVPLTTYSSTPYVQDDPLLEHITARMVLCHLTGWPNWRPEGQPLIRERPPDKEFGYSGEGYLYLQEVVEQVRGQPLEALMQETVLQPLLMPHSSYVWASSHNAKVAIGHDHLGNPLPAFAAPTPQASTSLHTTPLDYARFVCVLLTPGPDPGHLSSQWRGEMLRSQVQLTQELAWGLGWGLQRTEDGLAFWHWGDNPGFKSFTLTYLEARMGLIIMANGDGGGVLWEPLVALCLGGECPVFAWKSRQ